MTINGNGELKKRARLAKQRLKMGYWQSLKATQELDTATVNDVRVKLRRELDDKNAEYADERMYRKVCDILNRDETTINPIGQLIDKAVYQKLDSSGKQRYILELSNKFRELKERYYREKTGS